MSSEHEKCHGTDSCLRPYNSGMLDEQAVTTAEAPAPLYRSPLFFGPDGLRAGWGILMFLLLLGGVFLLVTVGTNVAHLLHPQPRYFANHLFTPVAQIVASLFSLVCIVASAVLLAGRGEFRAGKSALTLLLLLFALLQCGAEIRHVQIASQNQSAAQNENKTSPPSSQPAPTGTIQELSTIGFEALSFAVILLVSWIMSRIEDRNFGQYGLGGNARRWPQLAHGLVCGFAFLSLLILGLWLGHWITFNGILLHSPGAVLGNGILWLLAFTCVGFFEEFTFRGYLQYTLARGIGFGAIGFFLAAALFNFGFGFAHHSNPGESPVGLWTAGLIGFVFCISLWYTRSLWWAIGFHATWDWGESYFYGTADSGGVSQGRLFDTHPHGSTLMSGGATGPEGSVMCIGIIALLAIYIWLTLRNERAKSTNQALINPVD